MCALFFSLGGKKGKECIGPKGKCACVCVCVCVCVFMYISMCVCILAFIYVHVSQCDSVSVCHVGTIKLFFNQYFTWWLFPFLTTINLLCLLVYVPHVCMYECISLLLILSSPPAFLPP